MSGLKRRVEDVAYLPTMKLLPCNRDLLRSVRNRRQVKVMPAALFEQDADQVIDM